MCHTSNYLLLYRERVLLFLFKRITFMTFKE